MIKEVLDNLRTEQRRQLMHAFEHGFSQVVELPMNSFIGVNVKMNHDLLITETAGSWAYGKVVVHKKDV